MLLLKRKSQLEQDLIVDSPHCLSYNFYDVTQRIWYWYFSLLSTLVSLILYCVFDIAMELIFTIIDCLECGDLGSQK